MLVVHTALYAGYARRHRGQFVLRIEDTDQERSKLFTLMLKPWIGWV